MGGWVGWLDTWSGRACYTCSGRVSLCTYSHGFRMGNLEAILHQQDISIDLLQAFTA